jgi:hypothetical protein
MPRLFEDAGGRAWQVYLRPQTAGISNSANLGREDLVFECDGEEWVVAGYGLGTMPLQELTIFTMRDLFARAIRAPDDRVRLAPDDELSFYTPDNALVHVREMPTYRLFRFTSGEMRRYAWPANDPRDSDITSLRRQLQKSEPVDG